MYHTLLNNSYCYSHRASTNPQLKPWWLRCMVISWKQIGDLRTSGNYLMTKSTWTSLLFQAEEWNTHKTSRINKIAFKNSSRHSVNEMEEYIPLKLFSIFCSTYLPTYFENIRCTTDTIFNGFLNIHLVAWNYRLDHLLYLVVTNLWNNHIGAN